MCGLTTRTCGSGVARDRAFSFYYEDNLDLLREQGATIVEFSPLNDVALPADLDGLYLAGGYPELYADRLCANTAMQEGDSRFSRNPVGQFMPSAGGMMYLSRTVTTRDGRGYAMCGVLPLEIEMTSRLVGFGYVTIELMSDCVLGVGGFKHSRT